MKKIFLIAASAMMVLASCTKVVINYPEDAQPQEIAMFAVNKSATKAPVGGAVEGATFPTDYNMMVAAYLVSGTTNTTPGEYFTNKIFAKNGDTWTGGQYWPVSTATLNFVAIAPHIDDNVTTTISEKSATSEPGVATVNIANNQTNQYDVMYAVGQSTKTAGQQPEEVVMVFKHALSWVNFTFNTATTGVTIKINSVKINDAAYNGTLTVTSTNYTTNTNQEATTSWTSTTTIDYIEVPGAGDNFVLNTTANDYQSFGKGLLVVPHNYSNDNPKPSFTINYTVTQDGKAFTYDYTYTFTNGVTWEEGKKYVYKVSITLHEIEVKPSVEDWGDPDEEEINADEKVDNTPAGGNPTA